MLSDLGNKEIFAENLNYYMKINGVDRNKLCNDLEFNYTTVREWTNGTAYPRIDKIEMLANYFNIEKSDLIENREKKKKTEELDMLFSQISDLSEEKQKVIINVTKSIMKEIDKELDGKE